MGFSFLDVTVRTDFDTYGTWTLNAKGCGEGYDISPYQCEGTGRQFHIVIEDPCPQGKAYLNYHELFGRSFYDICECVWEETQETIDYPGNEYTEIAYIPSTWDGFDIVLARMVPDWLPFMANNCTAKWSAYIVSLQMDNTGLMWNDSNFPNLYPPQVNDYGIGAYLTTTLG